MCFVFARFWICAATHYRLKDGQVSACDSLITWRKGGIQFWRPDDAKRASKTDDGQTICPFVLFRAATKIQSTSWEQLVKISACCAALVKIDFLAVHPLPLVDQGSKPQGCLLRAPGFSADLESNRTTRKQKGH